RSAGRAGGVSTGRTSAPNTASAASQDDARGTKLPTRTRPTPKWTLISRVQSHRAGSGVKSKTWSGKCLSAPPPRRRTAPRRPRGGPRAHPAPSLAAPQRPESPLPLLSPRVDAGWPGPVPEQEEEDERVEEREFTLV